MKTKKLFIATVAATCLATSASAFAPKYPANYNSAQTAGSSMVEPTGNTAEEIPQFPGGNQAMFEFMKRNLRYPAADKIKGVSGIVVVRFIVEKDGSLDKIEVIKHGTPSMDKETVRLIKKMPKWIPGKKNGVPVPVSMAIPVNFKSK